MQMGDTTLHIPHHTTTPHRQACHLTTTTTHDASAMHHATHLADTIQTPLIHHALHTTTHKSQHTASQFPCQAPHATTPYHTTPHHASLHLTNSSALHVQVGGR
eukprot:89298-Lingulodinium_polyedra.AAC.1